MCSSYQLTSWPHRTPTVEPHADVRTLILYLWPISSLNIKEPTAWSGDLNVHEMRNSGIIISYLNRDCFVSYRNICLSRLSCVRTRYSRMFTTFSNKRPETARLVRYSWESLERNNCDNNRTHELAIIHAFCPLRNNAFAKEGAYGLSAECI